MLLQMTLFYPFLFFLWLIFHCIYICHIFIHSSVSRHLGCFHVLAVVNSTAMNIGVNVYFQIMVFSRYMPRNKAAGAKKKSRIALLSSFHLLSTLVSVNQQPVLCIYEFSFLFLFFFSNSTYRWNPTVCLFWKTVYSNPLPIF